MAYPPDLPAKEDTWNAETDLSPAATTVAFEPVLPALRVPVPAGVDDEPSKGPFVLAFKDEASWRRAWRNCEEQITAQCEAIARKGCAITASKACSPPWWTTFIPIGNGKSEEEREACEEEAMMACLAAAKEDGIKYAKATCEEVFRDARIAEDSRFIDPRFTGGIPRQRLTKPLQHTDCCPNAQLKQQAPAEKIHERLGSTNFRGRLLMGDADNSSWRDEHGSRVSNFQQQSPIKTELQGWEGGLINPKKKGATSQGEDLKPGLVVWEKVLDDTISRLKKTIFHS